jgi:hypothetical protein
LDYHSCESDDYDGYNDHYEDDDDEDEEGVWSHANWDAIDDDDNIGDDAQEEDEEDSRAYSENDGSYSGTDGDESYDSKFGSNWYMTPEQRLRMLEAELGHDIFLTDAETDAHWWEGRQRLYRRLYRLCARRGLSTYISAPAKYSEEGALLRDEAGDDYASSSASASSSDSDSSGSADSGSESEAMPQQLSTNAVRLMLNGTRGLTPTLQVNSVELMPINIERVSIPSAICGVDRDLQVERYKSVTSTHALETHALCVVCVFPFQAHNFRRGQLQGSPACPPTQ